MNEVTEQPGNAAEPPNLQPPPYLFQMRDLLRDEEPEVWKWFRSNQRITAMQESVQLDLLKSTVRIEPEAQPDLYDLANSAAKSLDLDVPVTIYQAKQTGQLNASISCDVGHAHLVLQGDLESKLETEEMLAVLGHELSHLLLWNLQNGEFLAAANMLIALSQDPAATSIHLESLRLFSLYTEIFCDRGAALAAGEFDPVVASLIKIETGVGEVRVKDYVKQAEEIFARDDPDGSREVTHPELFVRTRVLKLWQQKNTGAEPEIARMVEGQLSLDRMDLCRRGQAREMTRDLIDVVLKPDWMQCEATLAHAQLYFDEYRPGRASAKQLAKSLQQVDPDIRTYAGYVMLDFVTADRDLLEPALAHTIHLADRFGFKSAFIDVARKELRLRKKQVEQIEQSTDDLAAKAVSKKQQAESLTDDESA